MKFTIKVYLYDSKTGKQISPVLAKQVEKVILTDFQNDLARVHNKLTKLGHKALQKIQSEIKEEDASRTGTTGI